MNITDTRTFFDEISHRGYEPRLRDASGAWQFDIEGEGSWVITVDRGRLVGRPAADSEPAVKATLRGSPADFLRMVRGDDNENLLTPVLRGSIEVEGDLAFAQRLVAVIPLPDVPGGPEVAP